MSEGTVAILVAIALVGAIWLGIGAAQRHMDAVMNAWVGHSAEELVEVWGPPTRVLPAPAGAEGNLYVYEETEQTVTVVPVPAPGDGQAPQRVSYTVSSTSGSAYRVFWVDPAGRIYRATWSGLRWSNRLPNRFPRQAAATP